MRLILKMSTNGSGGSLSKDGGSSSGSMKPWPTRPAAATTMSTLLEGERSMAALKALTWDFHFRTSVWINLTLLNKNTVRR